MRGYTPETAHVTHGTARQGSRFNQHAVTQAYALEAKYDPNFNGNWNQDPDKNIATLPPSPG